MSLEIRQVSKVFAQSKKATLKQINLKIRQGEFFCVVGRSGCGKSTLLNLIAGLELPTEGEILMKGEKITGPGADRTVMFQEHALFPWLNVEENIRFGMEIAGEPEKEIQKRVNKYLEMMGLTDYRTYAIHQLSGGMRQSLYHGRGDSSDG